MNKIITFFFIMVITANSFGQSSEYDKLVKEGLQLLIQQNAPASILKYKAAYNMDSSKVEANYGLGVAYLFNCPNNGSDCSKAIYFLSRAIEIDPTYRNGYYNRGKCKGIIQDFNGALSDFNKAIQQNPDDKDFYFSRGMVKIKLQDNQGACEDFYSSGKLGSEVARKMFEKNCQSKNHPSNKSK